MKKQLKSQEILYLELLKLLLDSFSRELTIHRYEVINLTKDIPSHTGWVEIEATGWKEIRVILKPKKKNS